MDLHNLSILQEEIKKKEQQEQEKKESLQDNNFIFGMKESQQNPIDPDDGGENILIPKEEEKIEDILNEKITVKKPKVPPISTSLKK